MSALMSLFNVMRKELIQTLRDRRMVFLLIAAPIIQMVAFGYAIDLDVDKIPTVVCDQDRTQESRELMQAFLANDTFRGRGEVAGPAAAQDALDRGEAAVALLVPRGFAVRMARHDDPEVQVLIDGTDATRAQVAANDASQFLLLRGIGTGPGLPPPMLSAGSMPMALTPRILYNQRLSSPVYMLPGVAASLLLMVTAVITAMGLARERETGTLEQILVTPIRPTILLAGKCLPFTLFGLVDILAVLVLGSWVFAVPLRGSLLVVGVGSFLYLFSTLGAGILLATMSASQQQAILSAFSFILPAILLSGFMSPIASMPEWLQPLTQLNPMRHFVEIMRGCLLKGAGFRDLLRQFVSLFLLGIGILALAVARFRKRLS
jgi:ABC-2 type transport system permease protein